MPKLVGRYYRNIQVLYFTRKHILLSPFPLGPVFVLRPPFTRVFCVWLLPSQLPSVPGSLHFRRRPSAADRSEGRRSASVSSHRSLLPLLICLHGLRPPPPVFLPGAPESSPVSATVLRRAVACRASVFAGCAAASSRPLSSSSSSSAAAAAAAAAGGERRGRQGAAGGDLFVDLTRLGGGAGAATWPALCKRLRW